MLNWDGANLVSDMAVKRSTFCCRYFSALTRLDMGMLIWQVPQPAKAKLLTLGLLVAARAMV